MILRTNSLEFLPTIIYFEHNCTVGGWVQTSNIIGITVSTEGVGVVLSRTLLPAYHNSSPLHTTTLIDEHSIGGWAIGD